MRKRNLKWGSNGGEFGGKEILVRGWNGLNWRRIEKLTDPASTNRLARQTTCFVKNDLLPGLVFKALTILENNATVVVHRMSSKLFFVGTNHFICCICFSVIVIFMCEKERL